MRAQVGTAHASRIDSRAAAAGAGMTVAFARANLLTILVADEPKRNLESNKTHITFQPTDTTKPLVHTTLYFWRVRACNDMGCNDWTPYWKFQIGAFGNTPDKLLEE